MQKVTRTNTKLAIYSHDVTNRTSKTRWADCMSYCRVFVCFHKW